MLNDKEKYNDSLIISEIIGGLLVGIFTLGLPFILWYLFKFINFIQNEDFKIFLIGFSLCPLWIFIFLTTYKVIEKKEMRKKSTAKLFNKAVEKAK